MFQQLIIIGYVGQDPEARTLPSGEAVANFSVATSERWKNKSGELQERTEWHRCAAFGRTAEIASEYLKKGSLVTIIGSIHTRKWTDKEGNEKYSTDVKVDNLKLMPNGDWGGGQREDRSSRNSERAPARNTSADRPARDEEFDDDIPF